MVLTTIKIKSYDEQNDAFECDINGQRHMIDAACVASLSGQYDEPHAFIGLMLSVKVCASRDPHVTA